MNADRVNVGLDRAIAFDMPGADKCSLSLALVTFLDTVHDSASWWQKLGIIAVRSAIQKWRDNNCNKVT